VIGLLRGFMPLGGIVVRRYVEFNNLCVVMEEKVLIRENSVLRSRY
jgi:hypothetical protein